MFNGFQTANKTRQAESAVLAQRATLRVTEQTVLLSAAPLYMNLLRDNAILDLQRRNVEVLQEQLRQTRDRFNVGEVTRTDVAQSELSLAAGRSQVLTAEANYASSAATYRQVIGTTPGKLTAAHAGRPVLRRTSVSQSVDMRTAGNPSVTTAQFNVDVAEQAVKRGRRRALSDFVGAGQPTRRIAEHAEHHTRWTLTAPRSWAHSACRSIRAAPNIP